MDKRAAVKYINPHHSDNSGCDEGYFAHKKNKTNLLTQDRVKTLNLQGNFSGFLYQQNKIKAVIYKI
jgi:hypothetical protein